VVEDFVSGRVTPKGTRPSKRHRKGHAPMPVHRRQMEVMGLGLGPKSAGLRCRCGWDIYIGGSVEVIVGVPPRKIEKTALKRCREAYDDHLIKASEEQKGWVESRCPYPACGWFHRNVDPSSEEAAMLAETEIRRHLDADHIGWTMEELLFLKGARDEAAAEAIS
jgi:hypothetical protein